LDQFSENVHATNGLRTVTMRAIYHELCLKVTCVTSDLSGQGKTEWIKQECYKIDRNLITLLISNGVSYNSLTRKLKNIHI